MYIIIFVCNAQYDSWSKSNFEVYFVLFMSYLCNFLAIVSLLSTLFAMNQSLTFQTCLQAVLTTATAITRCDSVSCTFQTSLYAVLTTATALKDAILSAAVDKLM